MQLRTRVFRTDTFQNGTRVRAGRSRARAARCARPSRLGGAMATGEEDYNMAHRRSSIDQEVPEEDAQLTFAGSQTTILAEVARHRALQLAAARSAAELLASGDPGVNEKLAESTPPWAAPLSGVGNPTPAQMTRNRSMSVFQARHAA